MKMMFSSWHQIPCWASPASFWVCFGILSVTYEFSVDTIGCIYEFASCSMPIMLAGYVKMDNKDVLLQYPEEEAFFVVRKKSRTTGHRSATEKMVYFHQEECYVIWHLRKNRKKTPQIHSNCQFPQFLWNGLATFALQGFSCCFSLFMDVDLASVMVSTSGYSGRSVVSRLPEGKQSRPESAHSVS